MGSDGRIRRMYIIAKNNRCLRDFNAEQLGNYFKKLFADVPQNNMQGSVSFSPE